MSEATQQPITVATDSEMRALGFTDPREGFWYWCKPVGSDETLNITIDKATGEWEELVMDEFFGQPAYYGRMVPQFRDEIRSKVDEHVAWLVAGGILVAVDHSEYGCAA